jgi:WD40 repeat protein
MNWITSFALAPDGQTLAVAGGYYHQSGEVRLFDVATAQLKQVLTVDTNTVAAVAFAADGRTLFVGTRPPINPLFGPYRGQVQRWDFATGQQLAPLE